MKRSNFGMSAIVLSLLAGTAGQAVAQGWPEKPIRVIVPYGAGGNNDRIARTLSESMATTLGVPIVVENRGGAGGTVATGEVAKMDADGYTMIMCEIGTMAINPHVYKNLNYDPLADFEPVVQVTSVPLIMAVGPSFDVSNIEEYLEAVRDPDAEINYASSGVGSAQHLAFEQFKTMAEFDALQIPYNGAAPALTALLSGEVDTFISGTLLPAIQDGQITAIAVTGDHRLDVLPDVPTFKESGVEGVDFTSWHGFCVPKGTDAEIVDTLNGAVNAAMGEDEIKERFKALNIGLVEGSTPEAFKAFIESENKTMGELVELTGAAK